MAVIALFLAVYYGMLDGALSPAGVGWSCAVAGLLAYTLWRIGWESKDAAPSGRECPPAPLAVKIAPLLR